MSSSHHKLFQRGGYRGGRGGGRTDLSQDMGRMNLGDRPVQRGPSGGGGGGGRPQTQGGPGGMYRC